MNAASQRPLRAKWRRHIAQASGVGSLCCAGLAGIRVVDFAALAAAALMVAVYAVASEDGDAPPGVLRRFLLGMIACASIYAVTSGLIY